MTESDAPTMPEHAKPLMTIAQARDAIAAFPVDQQALVIAIARAASSDGFYRGAGKLPNINPFDHFGSEPAPDEAKTKTWRKR